MLIASSWSQSLLICLKRNTDYVTYCRARRNDNSIICEQLRAKFPQIDRVYADCGDVENVSIDAMSEAFRLWQDTRNWIYTEDDSVALIAKPQEYIHREGHLLLDVTLFQDKKTTLATLQEFIDNLYEQREHEARNHSSALVRLMLQPLRVPEPVITGNMNQLTISRLKKAIYVGTFRDMHLNERPLSITETILAIKKHVGNPLDWRMSENDVDAERRGTFKKVYDRSSEKSLIIRHRNDFDAVVRNTVNARFPDFT